MQRTNILSLFRTWNFDHRRYIPELLRIGDITAIRELKNKKYRRNYERGLLLLGLMQTFKLKKLLEFGTGRGYATACALLCDHDVEVYTIDNDSTSGAKRLLASLNVDISSVNFIHADSKRIQQQLPQDFDCVFIDGGHDYKSVKNDFRVACQCCIKGALVFDDFRNKHPGSKKFIKELKRKKTLVNTDGWIFENKMIKQARDSDGLINGRETRSGQVLVLLGKMKDKIFI